MSVAATARFRSFVLKFDNYKKSPYVSMREYLRYMSNMVSELAEIGYELTNKQQVHAAIRFLPNDWGHFKMVLSRIKYIVTFENIRR